MSISFKKFLAVLLTAALLWTSAAPAFAWDDVVALVDSAKGDTGSGKSAAKGEGEEPVAVTEPVKAPEPEPQPEKTGQKAASKGPEVKVASNDGVTYSDLVLERNSGVYTGIAHEIVVTTTKTTITDGADTSETVTMSSDSSAQYPLTLTYTDDKTEGVVTSLINVGKYTIHVKDGNNEIGTAPYEITPATATIVVSQEGYIYSSAVSTPSITVTGVSNSNLAKDTDYTVEYTGQKANGDVYKSADAPTDAGSYSVTVTVKNPNYAQDFESASFTVSPATVTVGDIAAQGYTGTEIKPVALPTPLTDADYKVTYSNNINVGTASYKVELTNKNYSFTGGSYITTGSFTITAQNATATMVPTSFVYDGEAHMPAVTVTSGGSTLSAGTDYTVTYAPAATDGGSADLKGVGKYTATITSSNYAIDKTSISYEITKKDLTLKADNQSMTYGGTVPAFTYTATGLVSGDSLNVTYTLNPNNYDAGVHEITPSASNPNYNIIVDTTLGILTVDKAPLTITVPSKTITVGTNAPTEEALKAEATVTGLVNGDTKNDIAFSVGYSGGTTPSAAGTYDIEVTADATNNKNYTITTAKGTLTINANSEAPTVALGGVNNLVYNGSAQTPTTVTVTLGGKTLVENTDYTVKYLDNTNAGTAKVTVSPKGNYSFAPVTETFSIGRASATVTAEAKSKPYGADDPKLTATVSGLVNGENASLISYTLSRAAGENVGEHIITPAGASEQGNYTVTYATANLTISKNTNTATVEWVNDVTNLTYTGSAQQPALRVTVDGKTLTADTDYTVAYSDNTNAGTATAKATVTAKGNYDFTAVEKTFTITKRQVAANWGDTEFVFDGTNKTVSATFTKVNATEGTSLTVTYNTAPNAVGTYTATATIADATDAANYTLTNATHSVKIVESGVSVVWTGSHKYTYAADTPQGPTAESNTAIASVKYESTDGTTYPSNTTAPTNAGSYRATATAADGYTLLNATYDYTIDKQIVNVSWTGNVVYAFTDAAITGLPTATTTPAVAGGVKFYKDGTEVTEVKAVGAYTAEFTLDSTLNANNYDVRNSEFTFTVQREAVSVLVDNWNIADEVNYTGSAYEPVPVLKNADTNVVIARSEYNVAWKDNVNAGTATITITDKEGGAYTIPELIHTFRIKKLPLTVTPKAGQSKVYGQLDPKLEYDVTGTFAAGENVSVLEGALDRDKGEDVSDYNITKGTLDAKNYEINLTLGVSFKIEKANLTITAGSLELVYGDTVPTSFTDYTVEGLTNGDKLTGVTLSRAAGDTDDVGDHAINVDSGYSIMDATGAIDHSGNYNTPTINAGNLKITPDTIVNVDWEEGDFLYTGSACEPGVIAMTTAAGRKLTSGYTVTYSPTTTTEVGQYTATAELDAAIAGNYNYDPASFAHTYNIFAAGTAVEVTWPNDRDDDYTGSEIPFAPTSVEFGATKLVKDTDYTIVRDGDFTTAGKHTATVQLTEDGAKKYNYVMNASATFTINPLTVTVTTQNASKYVGYPDPRFDFKIEDENDTTKVPANVATSIKQTAVLTRENGEEAGQQYTIYLAYADTGSPNYVVAAANDGQLTINDLPLNSTVVWKNGEPDYTYNGNPQKPGKSDFTVTLDGATIPFTLRYEDENSTDAGKYNVYIENSAYGIVWPMVYEIKKAPLTVSLNSDALTKEKPYDGTKAVLNVSQSILSYDGIKNNEDVYVDIESAEYASKDVGTREISVQLGELKGERASNYTLASTQANTLTYADGKINAVNLVITANAQTKVYDKNPATDPELTYTVEGLQGEDTITGTLSRGGNQNVGEYDITDTLVIKDRANYNYTFTGAKFTITPRPVNVAGILAESKTYNGNDVATLITDGATFDGILEGDTLTVKATGAFSDKNVGEHKLVTITYDATAPLDDGNTTCNYTLGVASAQQTKTNADITPQDVTIDGITVSGKTYDGTTDVAKSYIVTSAAVVSGAVATDVVELDDSNIGASYDQKNAGRRTVTVYGLALTGADADNYNLTADTLTVDNVEISKLGVTVEGVTVDDRDYDQTDAAPLNFDNAKIVTMIPGDDLGLTGTAKYSDGNASNQPKNVQSYAIELTGDDKDNYELNSDGLTLSGKINPLAIEVKNVYAEDKPYDGTAAATLNITNAQLVGVLNPDVVELDASDCKVAFDDEKLGTGKPVDFVSDAKVLKLKGAHSSNYTLDLSKLELKASIYQQTVTVLAVTDIKVENKVYDGTDVATIDVSQAKLMDPNNQEVSGIGIEAAEGTYAAWFEDKNVGQGKIAYVTGLSLTGTDAENYKLPDNYVIQIDNAAAITAKDVTIEGVYAESRDYDATKDADVVFADAYIDGAIDGDDVQVDQIPTSFEFDEKNAGDRTVAITGLTLDGNDAGNYNLTNPDITLNAEIYPIPVTVEGIVVTARDYNQGVDATLDTSSATFGGIKDGDELTVTATGVYDDKFAGKGKTVQITSITLDGADKDNYYVGIDSQTYAIGEIYPLRLDVNGITAKNKEYDGGVEATVDTSSATLVTPLPNDVVRLMTANAAGTFADADVADNKTVTVGGLWLDGVDARNYTLNTATATANITVRTLTVKAVASDKTYDGTTEAVDNVALTLEGMVSGEEVTVKSFKATFDSKDVNRDTDDSVLNRTITIPAANIELDGANKGNYTVGTTDFTAEAKILPKEVTLTIAADAVSNKAYDQTRTAAIDLTKVTVKDTIDPENLTVESATAQFVTAGYGRQKVEITNIVLADGRNGGKASNYVLDKDEYESEAEITKIKLTVTGITVPDREYDGTNIAYFDVSNATVTGILGDGDNKDDVRLDTTYGACAGRFSDRQVMDGKTVFETPRTLKLVGVDADNYYAECTENLTGNIVRRVLNVTGIVAADKKYDGNAEVLAADLDTSAATLVTVVAGEEGKVTLDVSSAEGVYVDANGNEDSTIGTGKKVKITGLVLGGNEDYTKNYVLADPIYADGAYNITARDATIVQIDGEAAVIPKVYDGNVVATLDLSKLKIQTPVDGDDVSIAPNDYVARYDDANAGEGNKTVTISYLRLDGKDAWKYKLPDNFRLTVGNATILKKEVQIVGVAVADKVYNGANDKDAKRYVKFKDAKVVGYIGNDALQADSSGIAATYNDGNVGATKEVTVTGLGLKGEPDVRKNYTLPANYKLKVLATITPKPVTVSGIAVKARAYDGGNAVAAADFDTSGMQIDGKVDDDDLTVVPTGLYDNKDAGKNKTVTLTLKLDGAAKANYVLSAESQAAATGEITPREVTVSGITAGDKTYDTTATATLDWSAASFETLVAQNDDVRVISAKGAFPDVNADDAKVDVTVTDIILGGNDARNYTAKASDTKPQAQIKKAKLYVYPVDATKVYGDEEPTLKYTAAGLRGDDELSVITGTLTREGANGAVANRYDPVGVYEIVVDSLTANNYQILNGNPTAALTIIKRIVQPTLTVTTDADEIVYNGQYLTPDVKVEDDLDNVIADTEYELVYTNNFDAGTATVTVVNKAGGNYDIHKDSVNFTILPAPLTVTPKAVDWTWSYIWQEPNWDEPDAAWWEATALVDGNEKIAVQLQRNSTVTNVKDTPIENDVSVKKVTITRTENGATRDVTANYKITATAKSTFTILPLAVTPRIRLTGMEHGNDPAWKSGAKRGFDYTGKRQEPVVTLLDAGGNEIPYTKGADSEYTWTVVSESNNEATDCVDSISYKVVITDNNDKGNYKIDAANVIDAEHSKYTIYPKLVTVEWDKNTLSLEYNGFQQTPTAIVKEFPDVKVNVKVTGGDGINVKNNPHTAEAYGFETAQNNLLFPETHPTTQYTITKATLTVTPDATKLTKVYGDKDAAIPYTYVGLKGDDAKRVKVVGDLHRATGEHAGSYAVDTTLIDVVNQFDSTSTGNYNVVLDKAYDYTITRRPLEVAWSNKKLEMSAEGWALDANNVLYRVFGNKRMKPDNLVIVDTTIDASVVSQKVDASEYGYEWSDVYSFDAGDYTFKVTDRQGGDFDITCPTNMKYRINPVQVTLNWTDHLVYNGKEQKPTVTATVSDASFTNVKLIADVQVVTQPAKDANLPTGADDADAKPKYRAFVKKLVDNGSDPALDQNTIDRNFKFDNSEHEFYITPAGLTVTADNLTKVYREPDPVLTYKVVGLLGEDTEADALTGALTRDKAGKPEGEDVGVYAVTQGTLAANQNYDMTFVPGTLTIVEKPVKVVNEHVTISDVPRTYNGQKHTPEVTVTVDGVVIPSDEYTVTYENNLDAGTAEVILADVPGGNYGLTFDNKPTLTFDILPKEVTLSWSPLTFEYDGKLHVPTCTLEGVIPGDKCEAIVSYAEKPIAAGTYTAFAADLTNKNYKLPEENSVQFVITSRKIEVGEGEVTLSKTEYTYNGKAHRPRVKVVVDGVTIPKSEYKVTYRNNVHAGTAEVVVRNVSGNYNLDFDTKVYPFTILQRTANLAWSGLEAVYDGKVHVPVATVANLVKGDKCRVTVKVSKAVENNRNVKAVRIGDYIVEAVKLSNKDYKLPEDSAVGFSILPRKVTGNLILTMKRSNKDSLKLTWTKVTNVDGYDVFMSKCNNDGDKYMPELVQTFENNSTFSWSASGLLPGTCYKAVVKAYILVKGEKQYVRSSLMAHCVTYDDQHGRTNPTKLTLNKRSVTLKAGKTFQIKAKITREDAGSKLLTHAAELRYFSTDLSVAKVSETGKVTALSAGTCKIVVETINGIYKTLKVTVR